jgi:glycosyltransferase involved in cell wall biosynthesis
MKVSSAGERMQDVSPFDSTWEVPAFTTVEFHPRRSRFLVIIPVINEGQRIANQLRRMTEINKTVDAVVVDGGSTDGSLGQDRLAAANVRALLIKTGPGKLSAQLRVGLAWGLAHGYEGVILIDGNDKDDPAAISLFVEKLENGFDHVQGSRFIPGGAFSNNPASRLLGIKLLHAPAISLAAGFRYTDTTNGFRAYSRRFLVDERVSPFRDVFSKYELHYYLAIRAARLGFKVCEVPVTRDYPPGEVPTKISKFRGNLLILETLFKACFGYYDPKSSVVEKGR